MADLKACLPSGREDTVAQEDMPGTTTTATIVTSAMTKPTVMEKTIAKESKMNEEWPEEDSDKEMEQEMVKLQIELETEKLERLKRVELRRTEGDMNFLPSRNLNQVVTAPEPSPGANPKVSKLVSRFETSASPIKMPRPPLQAPRGAGQPKKSN